MPCHRALHLATVLAHEVAPRAVPGEEGAHRHSAGRQSQGSRGQAQRSGGGGALRRLREQCGRLGELALRCGALAAGPTRATPRALHQALGLDAADQQPLRGHPQHVHPHPPAVLLPADAAAAPPAARRRDVGLRRDGGRPAAACRGGTRHRQPTWSRDACGECAHLMPRDGRCVRGAEAPALPDGPRSHSARGRLAGGRPQRGVSGGTFARLLPALGPRGLPRRR
mmetsp:Transcript_41870/g.125139  ORF Transcript_41870/g.125139 Transcript_41870/m.125139 type:complete len:226 (+) Transcript_41870:647-1324(+)